MRDASQLLPRCARIHVALAGLLLLLPVSRAQGVPLFFSMNGTETAASGAGGSFASPGNYAAIFRDEAVLMATPGATGSTAHACFDRATWAAFFGDDDGDGSFAEGVIGHVDALRLRAGAANPPTIFDFWVSFSDNIVGPFGSLLGVALYNGDVFRLIPGGGVQHFITEVQLGQAMNTIENFDVDGFTVDPATGDLYFSLTSTETVNGVSLEDGGVLRIPASGYVAAPDGTVLSVTTGAAQIVLHEVHVNILFAIAGQGAVGDLRDFTLAPAGGTFTGFGGLQLPNLWLCGDTATGGAVVVSSEGGGTIANLNGTQLLGGAAFGLWPTDFQGFQNSNLTGLTLGSAPLADTPRFLSIAAHGITTPGTLTLDAGGCTPGPGLYLFANVAVGGPAGAFTPRTPIPTGSPVATPGGFRELYVDDFGDPLFQLGLIIPPLLVDAAGYASISFALPAIIPGVAVALQALDLPALALTTPVIIATQ